jgi:hypothetical protein
MASITFLKCPSQLPGANRGSPGYSYMLKWGCRQPLNFFSQFLSAFTTCTYFVADKKFFV